MLVFGSMGWINPANIMNARGEKAVANFDEDAVTMATSAAMDCITGYDRHNLDGVYLATTTASYRERLCSNLVAGALGASEKVRTADFGNGLKAGTTALIAALDAAAAGSADNIMVTAADCRLGKMGSPQELMFGDGAAAFLVGDSDDVIAEFKGSFSTGHDFVDHFRGAESTYDRQWEDRWIRDVGFGQFIPEAIEGLCSKYDVKVEDFSKVIYPCYYGGARKKLDKKLALDPGNVQENMQGEIGDTGTAQPMMMLARALEDASPGDKLMVISYGSGCDALFFEVTDAVKKIVPRKGISGHLANKVELDNYLKYLTWRKMVPVDTGLRGEEDKWTRWSMVWRVHRLVLGMWGSTCQACGTQQFPAQRVCVNPACGAIDQMEMVYLADKGGKVFSYTSDMLASSINPPAMYGAVDIKDGGRFVFDFTDCVLDDLQVGKEVDFSFRIKFYDAKRDITNYFWKAVPVPVPEEVE
jgi:hydroxymethylglutaryl-CoA synthase